MTHPKLKIVTITHRPVIDKGDWIIPRESAVEIAARLRVGRGPVRQIVWRQSIDGERL